MAARCLMDAPFIGELVALPSQTPASACPGARSSSVRLAGEAQVLLITSVSCRGMTVITCNRKVVSPHGDIVSDGETFRFSFRCFWIDLHSRESLGSSFNK